MKVSTDVIGSKITKEFFSKTLEQDFNDGAYNKALNIGMLCVPHVSFSKDPSRKIISLRLDWGFMIKGLVEFFLDDKYFIDYQSTENEKDEIDKLIQFSKNIFINEFNKKTPKKINMNFNDFYGVAQAIILRDQIVSMIHSRD